MGYTPFPISDFKTGLFTAREAWLSPADAFSKLENANIFRGRVRKRSGLEFLGFFPEKLTDSNGAALTLTFADDGADLVEVTTSAVHGFSTGDYVSFKDVTGNGSTNLNYKFFFITVTSTTVFTLDSITWSGLHASPAPANGSVEHIKSLTKAGAITAINNTGSDNDQNVQIVTGTAHGLSTGDKVMLVDEEGTAFAGLTSLENAIDTITVDSTTSFTMNNINAAGFGTWSAGGVVGLVSTSNSNDIMGLGELFRDETDNILIANNRTRIAKWDQSNSVFEPLGRIQVLTTGSLGNASDDDPWSSTATDFVQMTNAFGKLWMTNFKDNVLSYDGTNLERETFNITGDGAASLTFSTHNDLDRCKFIFPYNRRLILLYTVEATVKHPQRVRWSRLNYAAGDTSEWDDTADDSNAGSLDADTDEEIVAATFLKDKLIVFFERSIWALEKTASVDVPFRWQKLSDFPGVFASRFGSINHSNFAWAFGAGGTIATDGIQIKALDEFIPDFEDEIDDSNYKRVQMFKSIANREIWIAYSTVDDSQNDKVKVLDYENRTWAEYEIPISAMTPFKVTDLSALTWADLNEYPDNQWQNQKVQWQNFGSIPGVPEDIIGDNTGIVRRIRPSNSSDSKANIPVTMETARLNPFKEQGKAARFGYVDFLVDEQSGASLTIELFSEWSGAPHTTETMDLTANTIGDLTRSDVGKIWKRVYVDCVGNMHRMRITQESTNPFQVHAIVPYFRPEGRSNLL